MHKTLILHETQTPIYIKNKTIQLFKERNIEVLWELVNMNTIDDSYLSIYNTAG